MKDKQKAQEGKQPRAQATMIPGSLVFISLDGVTGTAGCPLAQLQKHRWGGAQKETYLHHTRLAA